MELFIRLLLLAFGALSFGNMTVLAYYWNYEVKVVTQVLRNNMMSDPSEQFEVDSRAPFDTNNLPVSELKDMCSEAIVRVRQEKGIRVWFWEDGDIRPQKQYCVSHRNGTVEVAMAVKCPTKPAIFLQVLEEKRGGDTVVAIVVLPDEPVENARVPIDDIVYKLVHASSMRKASRAEASSFYNSREDSDPEQFTEGEFVRMCERALQKFPNQGISLTSSGGKDINFYKLRKLSTGGVDIVLAYMCPTSPPSFVTVPRQSLVGGYVVQFIVDTKGKEKYAVRKFSRPEYYVRYSFEVKVATKIEEVNSSTARGDTSADDVIEAAVSLEELSREDCVRLCRDGLEAVRDEYQYNYEFSDATVPEFEKYYTLYFENEDGISEESIDDIMHVEAFECPTVPSLYIHISRLDEGGNLIWAIIKDRQAEFTLQFLESIDQASTIQIAHETSGLKGIDTDDLSEVNRLRMCRKAVAKMLGGYLIYARGRPKETGMSRVYSIRTTQGQRTVVTSETVVRAFECATQPKIYLEVQLNYNRLKYLIRVLALKPKPYRSAPRAADTLYSSGSSAPRASGDTLISQMAAFKEASRRSKQEFEK